MSIRDVEKQTKTAIALRLLQKSRLTIREVARNSGLSKTAVEQLAKSARPRPNTAQE